MVVAGAAGCGSSAPAIDGGGAGVSSPARPASFTQALPATALDFEMVGIAGGSVTMPDGQVAEVAPFCVGRHEVTWDLYDVFVLGLDVAADAGADEGADGVTRPSKPYIAMDRSFGHAGYPAISMSAKGAANFCAWLSRRTGRVYRLPTEAEWRLLCARSGIDAADPGAHAWFADNSGRTTHPVGSLAPDANGLHDLWGNASEWCEVGPGEHVTMGGTYLEGRDAIGCEARVGATRAWNESDPQFPKSVWWFADAGWVGFRVVCDVEAGAP